MSVVATLLAEQGAHIYFVPAVPVAYTTLFRSVVFKF